MLTVIASILVFSVIVLVHEFGHYKAAKSVGIKIYEFAIGMGPTLFKKEKGGTIYSIRAVPIGGFVQMEGEEEDVRTSTSYSTKSVWQRFKVVAAGPIMNFVLALVLFIIISFTYGVSGTKIDQIDEKSNEYAAGIRSGDKIISINGEKTYIWEDIYYKITSQETINYDVTVERDGQFKKFIISNNYRNFVGIKVKIIDGKTTTIISPTDINSPAYKVGIEEGDKVIKVNDKLVNSWEKIINEINASDKNLVKLTVERNGKLVDINIVPEKQLYLGFSTKNEKSFITTVVASAYKTVYYIELMFSSVVQLIMGKLGSNTLGGPVMVISLINEAAETGIFSLINLAAFLSINIGFVNLLPIPALDGSKLLLLIIEQIRGRAIPIEKEGYIHFVGFVVLIGFMIFITYKDILRLLRI